MEGFNAVDVAVVAIVLLSAGFAFYRGFVREALAIGGWVGAAAVTYYGFAGLRPVLEPYIANETLLGLATGGILFLAAVVVFGLIVHFIVKVIQKSPLSALDRSLGFLFGVARGIVVVALLFLLGRYAVWEEGKDAAPEWLSGAASYTVIEYAAEMIERAIPENLLDLPEGGAGAEGETIGAESLAQPPVAAPPDAAPDDIYREDPSRLIDLPPAEGEGGNAPGAPAAPPAEAEAPGAGDNP